VWTLFAVAMAGTPLFDLELRPFSRADLVAVSDGRTSGTGVGEYDGTVAPGFGAAGGAWLGRVGLVGRLGVAFRSHWSPDGGDTVRSVGVIRPEFEVRVAFADRKRFRPLPYLPMAVFGDIPIATDRSRAYTEEEQDAAKDAATAMRAQLGGVGFRSGFGVDLPLAAGVHVGGSFDIGVAVHPGDVGSSTATTVWLATGATLRVGFEWGGAASGLPERQP